MPRCDLIVLHVQHRQCKASDRSRCSRKKSSVATRSRVPACSEARSPLPSAFLPQWGMAGRARWRIGRKASPNHPSELRRTAATCRAPQTLAPGSISTCLSSPLHRLVASAENRASIQDSIQIRLQTASLFDTTCSPCVCQPQYRINVSHHPCAILALGVAKFKYALLAGTRVQSRRQYSMYNRIHVCPYNPITTSARQSGNLCARPLNYLLPLPPKISNSSRTIRMGTFSSTVLLINHARAIYKSILVPTSLCFACMKLPAIRWKNRIFFKLANTFRLSLEKCFILAPPIFDISQLLTGSPGQHVPIRGKRNSC